MSSVKKYLWAGAAVVALAFGLVALIKVLLPLFIVLVVMVAIYSVMFKKRW